MLQITPQLVKELRDKTGAGMGDCKNALVSANGDIKEAIEILRKKGAASAAKRADRSANEGMVVTRISDDGKKAVILEVNCETDFVARNAEFERYADTVANALMTGNVSGKDDLYEIKINDDTVGGLHNEILAKFSENINIRRFEQLASSGYICDYIHTGSRLAVLVETDVENPSENTKFRLRDIAMQIAAMNPLFIDRSSVSKDKLDKEKEIYRELALSEGKKPEIADRIATGKLEKFFQEQCLVEQTFVKDPAKTVGDVIKEIGNESGSEVKVLGFRRYYLGESLD